MAKKDNRPKYGYRPLDILRRELLPEGPYNKAVGRQTSTPSGAWDRMPGEGMRQYLAFDVFRRLGPSRSLERTKEILYLARRQGLLPTTRADDSVTERPNRSESGSEGTSGFGRPKSPFAIAEKRSQRYFNKSMNEWYNRFNWVERAEAWDDHIYELARENERKLRREDQAIMADAGRQIRAKMLMITFRLLDKIADELTEGKSHSPKEIRELVLAAERSGLVRDNAFKGVKDLLDEEKGEGQLDQRIAVRLLEAMAGISEEAEQAALPGPIIDVTPE
jgi:hypothetical protein